MPVSVLISAISSLTFASIRRMGVEDGCSSFVPRDSVPPFIPRQSVGNSRIHCSCGPVLDLRVGDWIGDVI